MSSSKHNHDQGDALAFYVDLHPPIADFKTDILTGMTKPQKTLSAKYLYDQKGSEIFDDITRAPEYYPTRTELALLDRIGPELNQVIGPDAVVLEPGAGSSVKVRKLIDALVRPAGFVGMDISGDHVKAACEELASDHPSLSIGAVCHDFTQPLDLSQLNIPHGRRVVFFPGSTIGNFELIDALDLLKTLRDWLRPGDGMLIGVDLRKEASVLEAAYDDEAGHTAAFNFNLIDRINRELDGTLDPDGLEYRAFWNPYRSRIEMYLQASRDQSFTLAGETLQLRESETIHTENSHKFTIALFQDLARQAGMSPANVWCDEDTPFSIHWLERSEET